MDCSQKIKVLRVPEHQKINNKSIKNQFKRQPMTRWMLGWILDGSWVDAGQILDRCWADLGQILARSWAERRQTLGRAWTHARPMLGRSCADAR